MAESGRNQIAAPTPVADGAASDGAFGGPAFDAGAPFLCHPRPKWHRRWPWRRVLVIYLVLVVLSAVSQWLIWPGFGSRASFLASFDPLPADASQHAVAVRSGVAPLVAPSADGALDPGKHEPVEVAWRELAPTAPAVGERVTPTIVLLHGSPGSMSDFRHFTPELARSYRVIEVDLPGFGRSERWVADYGLRSHAEFVLQLLDALEIRHAHVLGFSMGSGVALNMADLAPDRVLSLTFYGGIGLQEVEGSGNYYFEHLKYRLGYGLLVIGPEFVPHFGLLADRSYRHGFLRNFMDTDQRPLREIMAELRIPTLIVHGERDILVPAWGAEAHHQLIRPSRLVMFADEGHFMLFRHETALILAEVVRPFVTEVEAEGPGGITRWSIRFREAADIIVSAGGGSADGHETPEAVAPAPGDEATADVLATVDEREIQRLVADEERADAEYAASHGRADARWSPEHDQLPALLHALGNRYVVTSLTMEADRTTGRMESAGEVAGAGVYAVTGDSDLPSRIAIERGMNPWLQMTTIAAATFVSEDLTCITAGMLVRRQHVDLFVAVLGCMLGIFIGDIGLWAVGRVFGRRLLAWPWIGQRIPLRRLERLGGFIDTHVGKAVLISRFLPGTRMPMYLAAGMLGRKSWQFLLWFAVAVVLWVPLVMAIVIVVGDAAVAQLEAFFGTGWMSLVLGVALLFVILRTLEFASTSIGRARLIALVSRLWRWEFWPSYVMYVPVLPWILYLSWRHRGFNTITAANPAIPHGGFVGESKYDILARLPADAVVKGGLLESDADPMRRRERLLQMLHELELAMPVVLKPDVGERGSSVRLVHTEAEIDEYLRDCPDPVLVQQYHAGPYEAGIFYIRHPHEERGRIFSITHKEFSFVEGDGESTFEQLIWRHERYRMQAKKFLKRHAVRADEVLPRGERVRLAFAGNHCQGTKFCDGEHLKTADLEARFDTIMRAFPGFYFGRADVRYTSADELRAGRGFAIVELNGVTSESTNIYDPDRGLLAAWQTMRVKWGLLFEIGSANRNAGAPVSRYADLARQVYRHLFIRDVDPLSD